MIFNPPQTVETRIRQVIPDLFSESVEEKPEDSRFFKYRWDFADYCFDILDSSPWSKQQEIADAYILALRQQHEKRAFEKGELSLSDLESWRPGDVIKNWIAIDAGHTAGKTWLLAKFVSHFFDCFIPSITYCFAPTFEQINDLLFKEIRVDRRDRDLPGFVFPRDTRIKHEADHFVTGRATNNSNSIGTERTHGQHGKYQLFIIDEAEGIPDYIWNSIQSMTSGGISIVVFARNPRTTTCRAHKLRALSKTAPFQISVLEIPNVLEGREVISNLAHRDYVEEMLAEYAEVVPVHNSDDYTFELPWQPDTIFKPQQEFIWRVLGVASENQSVTTFCPFGRYDAAVARGKVSPFEFGEEDDKATIGVDAARFGGDFGTVYIRRGNWLWRSGNFQLSTSFTFYTHILNQMEALVDDGVVHIEVRIDAGGGWGAGLIDLLKNDLELQYRQTDDTLQLQQLLLYAISDEQSKYLQQAIKERGTQDSKWAGLLEFLVFEVNFNGTASNSRKFYDTSTEMYYYLGAQMDPLCLRNPPHHLRVDVCERPYEYGMKSGYSVKRLISKDQLYKKLKRSPDDGDGAALAAAPFHIFKIKPMILHAG